MITKHPKNSLWRCDLSYHSSRCRKNERLLWICTASYFQFIFQDYNTDKHIRVHSFSIMIMSQYILTLHIAKKVISNRKSWTLSLECKAWVRFKVFSWAWSCKPLLYPSRRLRQEDWISKPTKPTGWVKDQPGHLKVTLS